MKQAELEEIYDAIARAVDAVAPEKRELFLAKLVLLLAHDHPDRARVLAHIRAAMGDLEV